MHMSCVLSCRGYDAFDPQLVLPAQVIHALRDCANERREDHHGDNDHL